MIIKQIFFLSTITQYKHSSYGIWILLVFFGWRSKIDQLNLAIKTIYHYLNFILSFVIDFIKLYLF